MLPPLTLPTISANPTVAMPPGGGRGQLMQAMALDRVRTNRHLLRRRAELLDHLISVGPPPVPPLPPLSNYRSVSPPPPLLFMSEDSADAEFWFYSFWFFCLCNFCFV